MYYEAYSVLNDYGKEACTLLETAGVHMTLANKLERPNEDELIELVQKYDILIIGAKEKMTSKVYTKCSRTKIIGTLSVGLDHICNEFLNSPDVHIINCPTSNVISVAEHTFAIMLSLKKKILEANQSSLNGSGRKGIKGLSFDISGSTVGVIGAGHIATEFIRIAQGFNMKIICNTRTPQLHTKLLEYGVKFVDLDRLLSMSDIITIHLPLTEQTRMLINKDKIDLMKETAVFINTSRAELTDIPYLISKLDTNPKFMVGLDIEIDEYQSLFSIQRDNLIVTPHIAGISIDAVIRMDLELCHLIIKYLEKDQRNGRVNS